MSENVHVLTLKGINFHCQDISGNLLQKRSIIAALQTTSTCHKKPPLIAHSWALLSGGGYWLHLYNFHQDNSSRPTKRKAPKVTTQMNKSTLLGERGWGTNADSSLSVNYTSYDNCSVATNNFVTDCMLQQEKLQMYHERQLCNFTQAQPT